MQEILIGWGSSDPDDLAFVLCAALRAAGVPCRVAFAFDMNEMSVRSIDIFSGKRLVARLPCDMTMSNGFAMRLANAIEAAARELPSLAQGQASSKK